MPRPTPSGEVTRSFTLEDAAPGRLACLVGPGDGNLALIGERLAVAIAYAGTHFQVRGRHEQPVATACEVIASLYLLTGGTPARPVTPEEVNLCLKEFTARASEAGPAPAPRPAAGMRRDADARPDGDGPPDAAAGLGELYRAASELRVRRGRVRPRTPSQHAYVAAILGHAVCFGTGPAGTGKTYLAVAAAVDALERGAVRRIVLTRPAVEAGEKLGFLPGDLAQKVDPYLRPLYDALFEMLGFEKTEKLIERQIIEIAPLAYMRGRTLNDAFIILDEAQNTTIEQMKMFLTRIGFSSQAVITGDPSQCDLPRQVRSGLLHALEVLQEVEGVACCTFTAADVVRHPVVAAIVTAYERWEHRSPAAGRGAAGRPAAVPQPGAVTSAAAAAAAAAEQGEAAAAPGPVSGGTQAPAPEPDGAQAPEAGHAGRA